MSLVPGTRLGPYEVTAAIGSGGMGEVYRARDRRLGRDVAIKVLPAAVAGDADRQARFEREARAVASLNHPHICAVYDVGRQQDDAGRTIEFLVMELLDGETLAARLARGGRRSSPAMPGGTTPHPAVSSSPSGAGPDRPVRGRPLPLDETLRIATQLADALAAAHRAGIVHRDLKPANVMLTKSGVKVLDFGLAKLHEPARPPVDYATATAPLTDVGVVMGTMPYMAPEQLQGSRVDARADLFSFGAILHEMVTGERAFAAESQAGLIAALLDQHPPPLSAIVPSAPPSLERIVQRCLEKDPDDRWQSAQDLAAELKWIEQSERQPHAGVTLAGPRGPRGRWRRIAAGAAGIAAVLLAVLLTGRFAGTSTPPDPAVPVHSRVRLPDGVSLAGWGAPVVALSPDGRLLAIVGMKAGVPQLFVHRLDRDQTIEVPDSSEAEGPFFSPDSQWIAFAVGVSLRSGLKGELKKYSLATGLTQPIADISDFFGGTWRGDGTIFFMGATSAPLQKVRAEGGKHENAVAAIRPTGRTLGTWGYFPQLLPDGRILLIAQTDDGDPRPAILDPDTGEIGSLDMVSPFARYLASGHLFYMRRDGTMMAAPFDVRSGRVAGGEVAVIAGTSVVSNWEPAVAVSDSGILVYSTGPVTGSRWTSSRLVRITDGTVTPLPFEPDYLSSVKGSTDGTLLAASTAEGSLWIYDLRRQTKTRLPEGGVRYRYIPSWSPDNSRIAFTSWVAGWHLYQQPVDGVSPPEFILGGAEEKGPGTFTPDGGFYIFPQHKGGHQSGFDLFRVRPGSGQPAERLRPSSASEMNPAISPDGRWLAYAATDSGRYEVFVQPYPGLDRRVQVSVTGSTSPRWSSDSRTLFYSSGTRLYAASVARAGADVSVGEPREVLDIPGLRSIHPMPDGSYVALQDRTDVGTVTELRLIVNWFEELNRLAPR